jgi:hypothetical protein
VISSAFRRPSASPTRTAPRSVTSARLTAPASTAPASSPPWLACSDSNQRPSTRGLRRPTFSGSQAEPLSQFQQRTTGCRRSRSTSENARQGLATSGESSRARPLLGCGALSAVPRAQARESGRNRPPRAAFALSTVRARETALEVRLAADPNVESEEQKRPEQDCCNCGQHPAHGLERIEVVVDCGDDHAGDDPDGDNPEREERWPAAEPHDSPMLTARSERWKSRPAPSGCRAPPSSVSGRGWLPRHASPAKVAKDGQHNNDDDDDQKPGRHVILSFGAPILRRADRYLQRATYAASGTAPAGESVRAQRLLGFGRERPLAGGARHHRHAVTRAARTHSGRPNRHMSSTVNRHRQ